MKTKAIVGTVLDDSVTVSIDQVCRVCRVQAEWVIELVEHGVVEPVHRGSKWHFRGSELSRLRRAVSLQRDLGINPAGIALILELMDELEALRARSGRM